MSIYEVALIVAVVACGVLLWVRLRRPGLVSKLPSWLWGVVGGVLATASLVTVCFLRRKRTPPPNLEDRPPDERLSTVRTEEHVEVAEALASEDPTRAVGDLARERWE